MQVEIVVLQREQLVELIESAVRAALEEATRMEPIWLTAKEAAAMLGIHPKTLSRMARRGEIPSARIGRSYRFRRADLSTALEAEPRE